MDYLILILAVLLSAFFGALSNKLIVEKDQSFWVFAFYSLAIIGIIGSLITYFIIDPEGSGWEEVILIACLISGGILFYFTHYNLRSKNIYETKELDPKINQATESADTAEIKLFGGDLDVFGNSVNDMDENSQYSKLRSIGFRRVKILCEEPNNNIKRMRYGKILMDLPNTEFRFYNPEEADLRVRGRIYQINGVDKLLMFSKIRSKRYKAIETDTSNSNGALYNNIWSLTWSLAIQPSVDDLNRYKRLYREI